MPAELETLLGYGIFFGFVMFILGGILSIARENSPGGVIMGIGVYILVVSLLAALSLGPEAFPAIENAGAQ